MHLFAEHRELVGEPRLLHCARGSWILSVGCIQLLQIALNALLYLLLPLLHLAPCHVGVP